MKDAFAFTGAVAHTGPVRPGSLEIKGAQNVAALTPLEQEVKGMVAL